MGRGGAYSASDYGDLQMSLPHACICGRRMQEFKYDKNTCDFCEFECKEIMGVARGVKKSLATNM